MAQGDNPFPKRVKAPSLDGGTAWLNTSSEITLGDLRGKVVLLDFWTYCCINCMHILPDLKFLEQKYANQLVVIGVHSAKFENEKMTENIRQAILRYEISHPVINDENRVLWRKLNVQAWPTLVVIDPEGYYCGSISGEGQRDLIDTVIARLVRFHRAKKTLNESPVRFDLERSRERPTPLKYPGKVLADVASDRLFISDSNHNRIVISSLEGRLIDVVGTGAIGAADGEYGQASFDHPQGMALVDGILYVADTENHLIRAISLEKKRVATLAGTGVQAKFRARGGRLRTSALNSPWDLVHFDGGLFIAMAGPHQIWSHGVGSDSIQVFAGTGREDVLNGPLDRAAFAQPSGLTFDEDALYVADSEGSAIRRVSLRGRRSVTTVAGTHDLPNGRSLFAFGDHDGVAEQARLQHPLGVRYHDGNLYVADTYNHKIKQIDLKTGQVVTWFGSNSSGQGDGALRLSEPGGLDIANGTLYVADTNNHRICTIDLATHEASVLAIEGLSPPTPSSSPTGANP